MNPVQRLRELGQSVWLDYIRRDLLDSGQLAELIAAGEVRGVTSNPTIFEQAIVKTDLYTDDMRRMAQAGRAAEQIMDALTLADIRKATDHFRAVYEESQGQDGFVSIEVSPALARDTGATLEEARRLWTAVNRPNVMVKIPATAQGIPAIEQAVSEGLNINITLIFSLERYGEVIEAYLRGLEKRAEQGASLDHVASVASFFVSRVDTLVDARLEALVREEGPRAERAAALMGKAAIANARLAYAQFHAAFESERFARLRARGARVQRPLWASTSTKNPAYPDTYYVDLLIGPDTVDTMPLATLEAFRDHGQPELTLERDLSLSQAQLEALESLGIAMSDVTDQVEKEGVEKFAASHFSLLAAIRERSEGLRRELGPLLDLLRARLRQAEENGVARRLWVGDPALWTTRPAEANELRARLGWLKLPEDMEGQLGELSAAVSGLRDDRFERAILLGMGGSSLAAEVLRRTFPDRGGLAIEVLDTSDPETIARASRRATPGKALIIAASKSGTTVEVDALLEHFWARAEKSLGDQTGRDFVAITDPGTRLEETARRRAFHAIIPSPAEVGGRYSALSVFGLTPALLLGAEAGGLVRGAARMAEACRADAPDHNPAVFLGSLLAAAAEAGRDKVTILADPPMAAFGIWAEQLIAESSGKDGKGLIPIVDEPPATDGTYGPDRLIVYLRRGGELDGSVKDWVGHGTPVGVVECGEGEAGLGAEFFRWELAVAVACHFLGVNAFNQPDVQNAKDRAAAMVKAMRRGRELRVPPRLWKSGEAELSGSGKAPAGAELAEIALWIRGHVGPREVLAVLVYADPTPALDKALRRARSELRDHQGLTMVPSWGPRYLHSTGQLYKGGPDRFVCLLVSAEPATDVEIPGWGIGFGQLQRAQAMGDLQALLAGGRRAFGLHFRSRGDLVGFVRALAL